MVGGKVSEIIYVTDRIWVDTYDKSEGYCAIYVKYTENSVQIKIGDSLWWQGPYCYWTPSENTGKRGDYDIPIERVSYSGVKRPGRVSQ